MALIGQVLQIFAGFFVRRLFLMHLGENYLGYESVFSNILQMLNMADLGISVAVTAFLYRPLSEKNDDAVRALMYLYKRIYQVIGVAVLLLGAGVSLILPVLIPDAVCAVWELRVYFYIALAGTASTYYLSYKRTLLLADQKSYIVMMVDTLVFLGASVCQALLLLFYPSYPLYLVIAAGRNLISNVIITGRCNRIYPMLKNSPDKKTYDNYKMRVLTYVKDLFIAKIGGYIFNSTDNLILSIVRGSVLAGYLSNYTMVTQQVNYVVAQILYSVQGTYGNFVSETTDNGHQRKMTDSYLLVHVFIGIFCMLCILFLIQPFVQIFFGEQYLLEGTTVLMLSINLMLTIILQLPTQIFTIYRLYHYDRPIIIVSAALNIVISALLVQRMGVNGVLIGTFIASLIYLFSRFYIIAARVYQIPYRHYVFKIFKYALIAAINVLIMYTVVPRIQPGTQRFMVLKMVIVGALAVTLPSCFLAITEEWTFIADIMLSGKLKKIFSKWMVWTVTAGVIAAALLLGESSARTRTGAGSKSMERKDVYTDEQAETQAGIFHLSFDDVIDMFWDLTENEEAYESIFENEMLGWMKELHDTYGVVISCYVFYQNDNFCLEDCTTRFRREFEENADWLRFGFHSLEPDAVYGAHGDSDILEDYCKTINCLKKISGGVAQTSVIRLHCYQADESEVEVLMDNHLLPVTALLCADDGRQSYYLNDGKSAYIYCHDEYTDEKNGMRFISTDIRIEHLGDVDKKIREFQTDAWNNQLSDLVIFTHEWALDDEIKEKVQKLCMYAKEKGYRFSFFEDIVGNE